MENEFTPDDVRHLMEKLGRGLENANPVNLMPKEVEMVFAMIEAGRIRATESAGRGAHMQRLLTAVLIDMEMGGEPLTVPGQAWYETDQVLGFTTDWDEEADEITFNLIRETDEETEAEGDAAEVEAEYVETGSHATS